MWNHLVHLRIINRLCPSGTTNSAAILVHCSVTSRLGHCIFLLFSLAYKLTWNPANQIITLSLVISFFFLSVHHGG